MGWRAAAAAVAWRASAGGTGGAAGRGAAAGGTARAGRRAGGTGGGAAVTEVESNNTTATANDFAAIAVNGRVTAAIGAAGDNDFFSLTIPAGTTALYITTFSSGVDTSCTTANTTLTLLAADGTTTLASSTNISATQLCSHISYAPTPGTYFVRVNANGADVDVRLRPRGARRNHPHGDGRDRTQRRRHPAIGNGMASFEGNNFAIASAGGPFSADTLVTGAFTPAGDEDVFAISNTGASPAEVYLETFNGGFGACTSGLDTQIRIRDASGAVLAFGDDAGTGPLLHVPALRDSGRDDRVRARHRLRRQHGRRRVFAARQLSVGGGISSRRAAGSDTNVAIGRLRRARVRSKGRNVICLSNVHEADRPRDRARRGLCRARRLAGGLQKGNAGDPDAGGAGPIMGAGARGASGIGGAGAGHAGGVGGAFGGGARRRRRGGSTGGRGQICCPPPPPPVCGALCGNGRIDTCVGARSPECIPYALSEECDGNDLGGASCADARLRVGEAGLRPDLLRRRRHRMFGVRADGDGGGQLRHTPPLTNPNVSYYAIAATDSEVGLAEVAYDDVSGMTLSFRAWRRASTRPAARRCWTRCDRDRWRARTSRASPWRQSRRAG